MARKSLSKFMKTTFKKAYIVPESATMQVLEPITPIMGLSGATGANDPEDDTAPHAPGRRKPF
jgi:hypothetical protein